MGKIVCPIIRCVTVQKGSYNNHRREELRVREKGPTESYAAADVALVC